MIIDVLTIFPEIFEDFKKWSIVGRAIENDIFSLNPVNIRDYSSNKHKKVDDYPFGGGPGMVMTPEPLCRSIEACKLGKKSKVIYLSPQGRKYNQSLAKELAQEEHLILLCGHYEGIDNRVIEDYVDMEISIGDYVLTGGEIPAMALVESVVRLLPGTLSQEDSFTEESHYNGLLEHPQYTRPREYRGREVPEVLLSGHHGNIEKWKRYEALKATYIKRPDMLKDYELSSEEKAWIEEIKDGIK